MGGPDVEEELDARCFSFRYKLLIFSRERIIRFCVGVRSVALS